MSIESDQYLRGVREQYENYPYPKRNPEDERRTIFVTTTEFLGKINHYCYKGGRDLRKGGRFLVAGGGTGDAAIFLAEQLRNTDSEVVYLDMSSASMDIAKKRAAVRQLDNITWMHHSLLELPNLNVGKFDYINCCGVLHHLESPVQGLKALQAVLKDDGCMGLMVYAQYGRTGIYQMQELLRLVNTGNENLQHHVDNAKKVLESLPATNWYKRDEERWIDEIQQDGDITIYDLFLHSQDRAYSIPQLYEWVEDCGLKLVQLTGFPGQTLRYDPSRYITNPALRAQVAEMPIRQQQAIAELMCGDIKTHTIYASARSGTIASPDDLDNVPFYTFKFMAGEDLYRGFSKNVHAPLQMRWGGGEGEIIVITQRKYTRHIFRYLDSARCLGDIFECVRNDPDAQGAGRPDDRALLEEFRSIYDAFNSVELMMLRNKHVPPYTSTDDLLAGNRS